MKIALTYLSFLLALGVWAGDWQFVSSKSLVESSVVQHDSENLDNSSSDELEISVSTDFVSSGHAPCSVQVFAPSVYPQSANIYGANLIRGPPPVLSA